MTVAADLVVEKNKAISPVASSESLLSGSGGNTSSPSSDDGGDNNSEGDNGFEGPEKNLEVLFVKGKGHPRGCRALDRASLDKICEAAKCTILSSVSNAHLDAYVLSESSLFVYETNIVIKTCGRTTLLGCLLPLLKMTSALGLELEWLSYSRKNYTFPDDQVFPHQSFQEEFGYLKKHPQLEQQLDGSGYVLGPITGDHWFVYVSDHTPDVGARCHRVTCDRTLNIMMFDLDPDVASLFYQTTTTTTTAATPSTPATTTTPSTTQGDDDKTATSTTAPPPHATTITRDGKAMTVASGINKLVPGAVIDDKAFEPCGYSMNAILYGSYSTVHITPEPECSVSEESDSNLDDSHLLSLQKILTFEFCSLMSRMCVSRVFPPFIYLIPFFASHGVCVLRFFFQSTVRVF